MRSAAAEGLGRLNDPAMLAALEKGFQEEGDASVRVSLAFALLMNGKLEVSEFSPLQFLVNSLNSAARSAAAQALLTEAARMPEVRRRLYPSLQQGTRDEKIGLARVMAQSGDKDTLPLLDRLTHDANVDVASEAIRALRSLRAHVE
jgi:HEAT repeat protein